jgi:hypothetical protein
MKRLWFGMLVATALGTNAAPMGILVPGYFDPPGAFWSELNFASTRVPLVAIMNPNNGPGRRQNPDYVAAVNSLRTAGGRVIGYVSTSYAARDTNTVKADIDRYFGFYAVDGIFLDEMTNDAITSHLNYYAALYQYIQKQGTNLLVVGNPGINTQEIYLTRPAADVLVTFESDTGYPALVVDGWVTNHLARQFCHLPYNVPDAATMTNDINLAAARNAGWIYVTGDNGANPWDTLPDYWTNEVNYVQWLNTAGPRPKLQILRFTNTVPLLQITGAPGTYEVSTSSNLVNWTVFTNVSAATNEVNFADVSATNVDLRFYRARQ